MENYFLQHFRTFFNIRTLYIKTYRKKLPTPGALNIQGTSGYKQKELNEYECIVPKKDVRIRKHFKEINIKQTLPNTKEEFLQIYLLI